MPTTSGSDPPYDPKARASVGAEPTSRRPMSRRRQWPSSRRRMGRRVRAPFPTVRRRPVLDGPPVPGGRHERSDHRRPRLTVRNRLLMQLPAAERSAVLQRATLVSIAVGDLIQEVGSVAEHVYFPESGLGSIVAVMDDGTMTEAASVGVDGFLGTTVLLGAERSSARVVWQVPGDAYRIPADDIRALLRKGTMAAVLLRFLQSLMDQMSRSSAPSRACRCSRRSAGGSCRARPGSPSCAAPRWAAAPRGPGRTSQRRSGRPGPA